MSEALLHDRHILVVEDDYFIAWALVDELTSFGAHVIGPAASVEEALALLANQPTDGAILDVSLSRDKVFPVASALTDRGIPFVFATGYSEVPPTWQHVPRYEKPVSAATAAQALFGSL